MLPLTSRPLSVMLSSRHPLAGKSRLEIEDLYGETLMLVSRGMSTYIDALRDCLEREHPRIHLMDVPPYGMSTFNRCAENNGLMIAVEEWSGIHPSLVSVPVNWPFTIPYGLLYAAEPSPGVLRFVEAIRTALGDPGKERNLHT